MNGPWVIIGLYATLFFIIFYTICITSNYPYFFFLAFVPFFPLFSRFLYLFCSVCYSRLFGFHLHIWFSDVLFTLVVHLLKHCCFYQVPTLSRFSPSPLSRTFDPFQYRMLHTLNEVVRFPCGIMWGWGLPWTDETCNVQTRQDQNAASSILCCEPSTVRSIPGTSETSAVLRFEPSALLPIVRPSPLTGAIPNASFFRNAISELTMLPIPIFGSVFLVVLAVFEGGSLTKKKLQQ